VISTTTKLKLVPHKMPRIFGLVSSLQEVQDSLSAGEALQDQLKPIQDHDLEHDENQSSSSWLRIPDQSSFTLEQYDIIKIEGKRPFLLIN
jgi:hypothetical protein